MSLLNDIVMEHGQWEHGVTDERYLKATRGPFCGFSTLLWHLSLAVLSLILVLRTCTTLFRYLVLTVIGPPPIVQCREVSPVILGAVKLQFSLAPVEMDGTLRKVFL